VSADTRQLSFPFSGEDIPKKKRLKRLSPQQERALERIASSSVEHVIGIDEVGMGSWAGPVVVAAVTVKKGWDHNEVVDSKRLSHRARLEAWSKHILPNAVAHCVLSQPSEAIDAEGIGKVRARLTESAAIYCRHRFPDALVVQDGDLPIEVDGSAANVVWLPNADVVVPAVSAASILAKVTRDLYMRKMAELYPGYGFETNVGYHSKKHVLGLERLGPTPIHRLSYKPVKAYVRAKDASSW
jgi:ribonuclease HII